MQIRHLFTLLSTALVVGCGITPELPGPDETDTGAQSLDKLPPPIAIDVPMTGAAVAKYKAVDDAIKRFMRERCVGGAVVGIALGDVVVHNRGYGYMDGPSVPGCATAKDPFIGGAQIQPNTPFRIGSNSKAVTAAILRLELKKALSAARGGVPVTDADIEGLHLIDNGELELVSPAVRAKMLPGAGDLVLSPCAVVNPWPKVTIGQLLQHKSGLSSGSEDVYEELSAIRDLSSVGKLVAQEAASGAPNAARTKLKADQTASAYFVPPSTLEEVAMAQGNRCFLYEPGVKVSYSNGGFAILGYVVEHVTGKSFNAKNGYPFMHSWSLLSDFTEEELGFGTGIEMSHTALGKRDSAEPRYRDWNASSGYYPVGKDEKRPWCVLTGGHCDFTQWAAGQSDFNWNWEEAKVPFDYVGHSMMGGVGYLAAEAPKYLAFMSRFAVSTPYGKDRTLIGGAASYAHTGSLEGTASYVAQFGSGTTSYRHYGNRANGTMSFDYSKSSAGSCTLPADLNFFFSMNQRTDANCTELNECVGCTTLACTDKDSAYALYVNVLKEALCQVAW